MLSEGPVGDDTIVANGKPSDLQLVPRMNHVRQQVVGD
jgi:hypothetical protein